jgi:hypothetical protein
MVGKLKNWLEDRIQGYLVQKGLKKFVTGATVAVGGVVATFLAKPAIAPVVEKLHQYGVDVAFKDGVFSLQASVEGIVTALGAGGAAVAMNFLFRKKDQNQTPNA